MPKPRQPSRRGRRSRRRVAPAAQPRAISPAPSAPQAAKPAPRAASPGIGAAPAVSRRAPTPAPPTTQNKYIRAELRRIGIIAGAMIIFLIVLGFFLR